MDDHAQTIAVPQGVKTKAMKKAPKRKHLGTGMSAARCDVCKFPTRSDGYQGHHNDCPVIKHCDDYIDDPAEPDVLRKYLAFARAPAHGQLLPKPHPRLYADYKGQRVRVTMASQLGDVGISTDLDAEFGYERRTHVHALSNFSETP